MSNNRNSTLARPLLNQDRRPLAARACCLSMAVCAPILLSIAADASRTSQGQRTPVEQAAASAPRGDFDRAHYDRYAGIGARAFDRLIDRLENTTMSVGGERPIDIRMKSVAAAFRPGYPEVTVPATARDRTTGAEAEIMIDARLVIDGDPADADSVSVRPIPIKIVPRRKWSLHNLARWEFAQRLRAIDGADLAGSDASHSVSPQSGLADDPAAVSTGGSRRRATGGSRFAISAPIAGGLRLV